MPQEYPWYLPEGISEVLPPDSRNLERMRREILNLFESWGYELVVPPMVEFLESLLSATGRDLDLQTFKVTDQLTGRLMGVRADMTPQVARIDAHGLKRDAPNRLCYLGPVLHCLPGSFAGSRNPFQVGAELYGHDGLASDAEVLCLMVECLRSAGATTEVCVDLGHTSILRSLARRAGLNPAQTNTLFDLLQRKARTDLEAFCSDAEVPANVADACCHLIELNGDGAMLDRAGQVLHADDHVEIKEALNSLRALSGSVSDRVTGVRFHYDLAEVGGFRYYTGIAFAAYLAGQGQAVAKGGRYNDIGRVFGRARPATGFSTDIKRLLSLGNADTAAPDHAIFAPWDSDPALQAQINELRKSGERVIVELPGQTATPADLQCNRRLALRQGIWVVSSL